MLHIYNHTTARKLKTLWVSQPHHYPIVHLPLYSVYHRTPQTMLTHGQLLCQQPWPFVDHGELLYAMASKPFSTMAYGSPSWGFPFRSNYCSTDNRSPLQCILAVFLAECYIRGQFIHRLYCSMHSPCLSSIPLWQWALFKHKKYLSGPFECYLS